MERDIINAPALGQVVDGALATAPPALRRRASCLRRTLLGIAAAHHSVKPARRRRSDPDWAQSKFGRKQPLWRFCIDDEQDLREELTDVLRELAQLADIAGGNGNAAQAAEHVFKTMPHLRPDTFSIGREVRTILEWSETERLMRRRSEVLRTPSEQETMGLVGRRCVTVDEIIALGLETRNCMKDEEQLWRAFVDGRSDFWVLRSESRVAAVIETRRPTNWVRRALAPCNEDIALADLPGVAAFCTTAGLRIDRYTEGLLPDFAAAPVLGPKCIETRGGIATYAEWEFAVRIDFRASREVAVHRGRLSRTRTLILSIPPDRSTVAAMAEAEGWDLRSPIEQFGRKKLLHIVAAVARASAEPSLIQHRLLALAAG